LDFKILILLIAIYAIHNADSIKINRLIFQLRKSYNAYRQIIFSKGH